MYFDFTSLGMDEKIDMKKEIDEHLLSRIPKASKMNPNAWYVTAHCFAEICYKYDYLNDHLHDSCPLRNAAVFRDIPEDIVKLAEVRFPWNKTEDTPKPTGIPPHVNQLAKL